jgi:hypothetical protein
LVLIWHRPTREEHVDDERAPDVPTSDDQGVAVEDAAALTTGDARVDGLLARLDELDEGPLAEQVEVYEDIHRGLSEALGHESVG